MNAPADQVWSQAPDNIDNMASMTTSLDDISNIFNIDDFNLDSLPDMDGNAFGEHMPQSHPGTHPTTPFDENMGQLGAPPGTVAQDFGSQNDFGITSSMAGQQQYNNQPMASNMHFGADPMFQPTMQQQYPQQQQSNFQFNHQQQFPHSHQVPPTPNSLDLHGEAGRFMQQQMDAQQRAMLEQQYQMRKEQQVQFTPLASPSSTPYHIHQDFTVPGDFFSPLTSPALHAQNASQSRQQFAPHQQGFYTNPSTAASSAAPSPIDANGDVEMGGEGAALPDSATQTKKPTRRKPATPRTFAMNKVKQSPIQKAQKRKSVAMGHKDADTIIQDAQRSGHVAPRSAGLQMPPPFESSENDSVSPEALSDLPMGPPPRPGSISQSPAIAPQNQAVAGPAATPKSLLSMKPLDMNAPASTGISGQMGQASLEDLELPEAAENRGSTATHSQVSNSQEPTPRLMASRKTPKLGPLSTPSSSKPISASNSPAHALSPMTASTPAGLLKDKKDAKGGRATSKKRGSVSTTNSALVSPALRPKVSPSIKPLLPEGTSLHSPTHALLLASKSNYQNLLEGNHLPGISYPDSLSTGLTSKRTSHKVAEQGRRNRINDALKEMQALIPASSGARAEELMTADAGDDDSPEAKEKDRDAAVKSNSSKAATVESANRYIRVLKESDAAQKTAIAELRDELERMREKLGEKAETKQDEPAIDGAKDDTTDSMSVAQDSLEPEKAGAEAVK
ncbi:hypothetical protein Q7P37_006944 [Cladosporium fusiforme]